MSQRADPQEAYLNLGHDDGLNHQELRLFSDVMERLSTFGVGKIVDFPQIIVVGEQSAGKSAVLSALSTVGFPSHDGGCTRFATELVLSPRTRYNERRRVTASIHFNDASKPAQVIPVDGFDRRDIQPIVNAAEQYMGLPETGQ